MRRPFLAVAFAALLISGCDRQSSQQSQASSATPPAATTKPSGFPALASQPGGPGLDLSQAGKPMPKVTILDADGEETTLPAIAGGKPLLVNLWATWCAPCVKELPTLDTLAQRGGTPQVIALSQDMQPQSTVSAFLDERKIGLESYQDKEMAVSGALGVQILPTTILYGSDGKEVWRYSGDLDWTSDRVAILLKEAK